MSGLGELGENYGFVQGGAQVSQADIDQYDQVNIAYPSVDGSWIGTYSGTGPAGGGAIVIKNILMDWPRNVKYAVNGIANGTYGGTFTANYLDQFGSAVTEKVTIGTAVNGGTTLGTAIVHKYLSGTFQPIASAGTFIGTAAIGAGTAVGASGCWFGLLSKIAATSDVKLIRYTNNGVVSVMGGGSLIGTNVSVANHAFQGTGGVIVTDTFTVVFKPSFDNTGKGTMSAL